jgi:hypothetical protein
MAKMKKIPLKVQKFTKKLPQNWKNDLKLKNDKKDQKLPIEFTFL